MLRIITNMRKPRLIIFSVVRNFHWLFTDTCYLKILYRLMINKKLHLDNPQDYQEKLQWL